ncbi:MAG: hypothetical protein WA064_00755 [Candidatus Moraniibacteriota bacterium]
MDRTKRVLILLLAIFGILAIILVGVVLVKNYNETKKASSTSPLIVSNQKKDKGDIFVEEISGKIEKIEGNNLVIVDNSNPLVPLTKNAAGMTVWVKLVDATAIFSVKKDNSQEKKQPNDLHVGDMVKVEYHKMTKQANVVYVATPGVDLGD